MERGILDSGAKLVQMMKPRAISGFPEWSPAQTLAEQKFIRQAISVYESYGYTPLDTPAVERVETLTAKGVVDKEIYALDRLKEESRKDKPRELGLRFDLTIPLARYVALNYGQVSFPFKRYQVGKVWRGERPQEGRFREFYQADIDVIAEGELPLHFDSEMPRVILEIFRSQGIKAKMRINNRKLLLALYRELGVSKESMPDVLREADKLEKVGREALLKSLGELGLESGLAERCVSLAGVSGDFSQVESAIQELGINPEALEPGLSELKTVAEALSDLSSEEWCLDLGIVRGLDYYTGTIYETNLVDYPELGSVCSGGRYDNLTSGFIKKQLPGVGISIGVSRLISYLFKVGALSVERHCPTEVLIILPSEERRSDCTLIAKELRAKGVPTEIYHQEQAMKKQLRYADRKGIPKVLFPHKYKADRPLIEVKTLATGDQVEMTLEEWLQNL